MGDGVLIKDPLEILKSTETTGAVFRLPGQVCQLAVEDHAGGTIKLQYSRDGGANWHDVGSDYQWGTDAILSLYGSPQLMYRLTGGSAGAVAFAMCASVLNNEEAAYFALV